VVTPELTAPALPGNAEDDLSLLLKLSGTWAALCNVVLSASRRYGGGYSSQGTENAQLLEYRLCAFILRFFSQLDASITKCEYKRGEEDSIDTNAWADPLCGGVPSAVFPC
jgi:hypothetical protein